MLNKGTRNPAILTHSISINDSRWQDSDVRYKSNSELKDSKEHNFRKFRQKSEFFLRLKGFS